jgi:hypothetical protein
MGAPIKVNWVIIIQSLTVGAIAYLVGVPLYIAYFMALWMSVELEKTEEGSR